MRRRSCRAIVLTTSVYIVVCSARNRVRMRLRRLREPRYLIGAVVGAAYLYFTVFARARARRAGNRRRAAAPAASAATLAAMQGAGPSLGGIALLVVSALAWMLPFDSGLLDFSPAEVQFLFPAPVTRRALLIHRLLRSQLGLLFSAVIMALAAPAISGYTRVRAGIAMWLMLTIGKVYFTGVSLARTHMRSNAGRAAATAWLPAAAIAIASVVMARALAYAIAGAPIADAQELLARIGAATSAGAAAFVLSPFAAIARPFFATGAGDYALDLAAPAIVLAALVAWVLRIDAAFEDAAATAAERKAAAAASRSPVYRVRRGGLTLAASGRPEGVFAWKAATQTLRVVDRAVAARLIAIAIALTVLSATFGRANGLATLAGSFAMVTTAFTVLFAPQVLRVDLRDDLRHLELLKTWPVGAAAVIRGELLWPAALLTAAAWAGLAVVELLAASTPLTRVSMTWRLSAGAALAMLAPALVAAQLTIQNAAAVLFPAWVPLGGQRPRGLDAMGQRLILLGASWLLLIVSVLPGAILGLIAWFALRVVLGAAAVVPAAGCCAAVVAVEVLLATEALGPAYEALDATAIERSE
ncbi:MAG TPA: putative ABC exporter domain-containing protein [Vicinamibacterales bacterium]|nr:putative ABC exporter domain-containing protein [Vicinamibacterales bacterium]